MWGIISEVTADQPDPAERKRQQIQRVRWSWTAGNVILGGVTVWSFTSDVWEAFVTAFLASALLQLLWMRRNL